MVTSIGCSSFRVVLCFRNHYPRFKGAPFQHFSRPPIPAPSVDWGLLADNQLKGSPQGYWAQKFLVMCLARNMTVHSYPSEDSYYGDLFGPMLDAAIIATLYTWKFAKARGWA